MVTKAHEAIFHLSELPTNKRRRKRAEQAFEAMSDSFNSIIEEAGNIQSLTRALLLPELRQAMQNLEHISCMLPGGLTGQLRKAHKRVEQLMMLSPAMPDSAAAAVSLQPPAGLGGE